MADSLMADSLMAAQASCPLDLQDWTSFNKNLRSAIEQIFHSHHNIYIDTCCGALY